jgi:hypothetical protein
VQEESANFNTLDHGFQVTTEYSFLDLARELSLAEQFCLLNRSGYYRPYSVVRAEVLL